MEIMKRDNKDVKIGKKTALSLIMRPPIIGLPDFMRVSAKSPLGFMEELRYRNTVYGV